MTVPAPEDKERKVSFERERGVYAIQVMRDVAQAVVSVGDDGTRSDHILHVFSVLAESDIPVFLIKLHSSVITLACSGADTVRTEQTLAGAGLRASTRRDLAVIVVCATLLQDVSGIMVTIADALSSVGVPLLETSDAHNSVQCLVETRHVSAAVEALCRAFHLDKDGVCERRLEAEEAA
ncbi:MAG TPA: ACT domain-containing protein [Chthonomonadaceae bacterium]|nr:ACT domain-containing protein [Chthonomonadaceae bacterium]